MQTIFVCNKNGDGLPCAKVRVPLPWIGSRGRVLIVVMHQEDPAAPQTLGYATPVRRRSARAVVIPVAALHFGAFVVLFFFTFSRGMSRFDSGAAPSALERAANLAFAVLFFPLLPLSRVIRFHVPGPEAWLLFAANSLLWGLAFWLIVRSLRRLRPAA